MKTLPGLLLKFSFGVTLAVFAPSPLYAETLDDLYSQGYSAYLDKNYVRALEYLAAYKHHPDAQKADSATLKSVDDAIKAIESSLDNCMTATAMHTGGGGGSFRGQAKMERKSVDE